MEDIIMIVGWANVWVMLKIWGVVVSVAFFVWIMKAIPPVKSSIAYKRIHGYGRDEG